MEENNSSGCQSGSFFCGAPDENTQETPLPDLNLGLSLGGIHDGNFKERPFTKSFTELINLNKDSLDLGNMLSLEMSGSFPIEGGQEQGTTKRGGIAGEEKSPEVTACMVASVEKNPLLLRALAQIKAAERCKFRNRMQIYSNRTRDSLMGESGREINFSAETADGHEEVLLHRSSEKTKETQFSYLEKLERFDLNLTPSLSGINDDNFNEKPLAQSPSVPCSIDLTKGSDELGNTRSLARTFSIPTEEDQDQTRRGIKPSLFQIEAQNRLEKQRSGVDNIGKEKVSPASALLQPSLLPRIVPLAENNPALHRALSRIKEANGCVYSKRLRLAC